ncbi:MAG: hypothetical protein EHM13_04615, partial [Acidobacteria bacterium]
MSRLRLRLLIGLVVAVALAWGATLDLTAAKAAAKATAKAVATATAATKAPATGAAKPAAKAAKATTAARLATMGGALLPSRPVLGSILAEAAAAAQGKGKGKATRDDVAKKFQKVPPSELKAAAKRAVAKGMKPGVASLSAAGLTAAEITAAVANPGGIPHYFGPYGNVAFSPLPKGGVATIAVTSPGTGYVSPVVTISDVYGPVTTAATATATTDDGVIYGFTILSPGSGYVAPHVTITDTGTGTGAAATALVDPTTKGIIGFDITSGGSGYAAATTTVTITDDTTSTFCGTDPLPPCGSGAIVSPLIGNGGIVAITVTDPGAGYSAPWVTITDSGGLGDGATGDATIGGPFTGGLPKFVDSLAQLGPDGANTLGQYLPVGVATPCNYSNQAADCYAIGLVEYSQQMHRDLPVTKLRGYVQLETPELLAYITLVNGDANLTNDVPASKHVDVGGGQFAYDNPHYLGPIIVAQGRAHGVAGPAGAPKPVRVTFYNLLPTDAGGNLFLPVDESVPGSGLGPS